MRFALDTEPQLEGALVAIDPETGEVKALVGGVDFRRSQFNRAVQARRQPGSAFKPFIYAAAIDHGYTAGDDREDAPISLPDGRRGSWSPKNFHNRYMGPVPLRTALTNSLNTVSVRLALDIGIDPLRDYLRIFGFPTEFPRNFSLALGSSEVTLLDLTRAYGVFATLGRRFEPVFVTVGDRYRAGSPVDFPGSQPRFEPVHEPRDRVRRDRHDADRGRVGHGEGARRRSADRPPARPARPTSRWTRGSSASRPSCWSGSGSASTPIARSARSPAGAPRRRSGRAFMQRALEGQPGARLHEARRRHAREGRRGRRACWPSPGARRGWSHSSPAPSRRARRRRPRFPSRRSRRPPASRRAQWRTTRRPHRADARLAPIIACGGWHAPTVA